MPPNPQRIWLLANIVKQAIIDGYECENVELPCDRFVSPGTPAWDYDDGLLAVQVETTFGHSGLISTETLEPQLAMAGHALRGVLFAIHLIRCVPMVDVNADEPVFPSIDAKEDAAEVILTDAQLLLNVLVKAERDGDLPGCSGIVFQQWQSVGPQGGLGGGILRVRIGLE